MKVFISWSGQSSQKAAILLRDWLPTIISDIEPWVSSEDIEKGRRWSTELDHELDTCDFGIICIDSSNVNSSWLNFEAGALSKSVTRGRIFPLVFGISLSELEGPLTQFQITTFDQENVLKLVISLSKFINNSISEKRLNKLVNYSWPALRDTVAEEYLANSHSEFFATKEVKIPDQAAKNEAKILSDIERDILLALAHETASMNHRELNEIVKVPRSKIKYYTSELEAQEFISSYLDDNGYRYHYYITNLGTGYLLNNDLF